jgi:hypothetical protein
MEEQAKTSDADYHHGAEELARIFETRLMRHLVDLKFSCERKLLLCVGNCEVELLIDSTMSSDTIKFGGAEGRILAQVVNVRTSP